VYFPGVPHEGRRALYSVSERSNLPPIYSHVQETPPSLRYNLRNAGDTLNSTVVAHLHEFLHGGGRVLLGRPLDEDIILGPHKPADGVTRILYAQTTILEKQGARSRECARRYSYSAEDMELLMPYAAERVISTYGINMTIRPPGQQGCCNQQR